MIGVPVCSEEVVGYVLGATPEVRSRSSNDPASRTPQPAFPRVLKHVVDSWEILAVDGASAAAQMAIDEALARVGRPVFRLFRWVTPSLSFGWRQPLPRWVDPPSLASHGVESVERPTGGGMAVHGSDLSYSIALPHRPGLRLHALLRRVCESLTCAVQAFGIFPRWCEEIERPRRIEHCLTDPSPYALMVAQQKLSGLAIRRYPASWLIQGSLLVGPIPTVFARLMPPMLYRACQTSAVALEAAVGRPVSDEELNEALIEAWQRTWS